MRMYNLRLRYPQEIVDLYEARIRKSHIKRVRIIVYTWNFVKKYMIENVVEGSVEVDRDQRPCRRLDCRFIPPTKKLDLAINDVIQVWYDVECPELNTADYDYRDPWVKVPIFYGLPQSLPKKKGDTTSLVAVGYEQRYNVTIPAQRMIRRGTRHSDAVRMILNDFEDICGANRNARFRAQTSKSKTGTNYYYGTDPSQSADNRIRNSHGRALGIALQEQTAWGAARKMSNSAGAWPLFVDGDGYNVLRKPNYNPVIILDESSATMLEPPESEINWESVKNGVVIYGTKLKNGRYAKGEAWSTGDLAPGTIKWRDPEVITGVNSSSKKVLNAYAVKKLKDLEKAGLTVGTTNLVEPRLQEYDWMRVSWGSDTWSVPIISFNIPFKGATQTIASKARKRPAKMYNLANPKRRH